MFPKKKFSKRKKNFNKSPNFLQYSNVKIYQSSIILQNILRYIIMQIRNSHMPSMIKPKIHALWFAFTRVLGLLFNIHNVSFTTRIGTKEQREKFYLYEFPVSYKNSELFLYIYFLEFYYFRNQNELKWGKSTKFSTSQK